MALGTELLVEIFDELVRHGITDRRFRRLYCEAGQSARKAMRYSSDEVQRVMMAASEKCGNNTGGYRISTSTFAMVFQALARCGNARLIRLVYEHGGGKAHKAVSLYEPGRGAGSFISEALQQRRQR